MNKPLVSVVIPTFNRAGVLPRALDSVIVQTCDDWEIVLIDDGSTDDTSRIASEYADRLASRFVYRRQENKGASAARNLGISLSRGRYVAFLDSDDAFVPTKLDRQLALFDRCPEWGLVFSDYACVDLNGRSIASAFDHYYPVVRTLPAIEIAQGLHACSETVFESLLRGYFIATIVGMVRREVLGDSIRFAEHLPYAHEWLFYLQIARCCRVGFVDEPLSVHYFTPGSITRTDAGENLAQFYKLLCELPQALAPLTCRQRRIVARHLSATARSLGAFAYRTGAYREAAGWFAKSFLRSRGPRDLYDTCDALFKWVGSRNAAMGRSAVQASAKEAR